MISTLTANEGMTTTAEPIENAKPRCFKAYVDGSYKDNVCRWAVVLIDENDQEVKRLSGILTGPVAEMHQIGGELKAAIEAVRHAEKLGGGVEIYHDYTGIYHWVADLFGQPSWRAKNVWTEGYQNYMRNHRNTLSGFTKVKAHSGDKWNSLADKLASTAD